MAKQSDAPHDIRITVEGGVIQAVEYVPAGVRVAVMDFDVDGYDASDLKTSDQGDNYLEVIYDSEGER